ncbi:hypothetical protein BaRGS_00004831, partial [Batillaria attramentaria]
MRSIRATLNVAAMSAFRRCLAPDSQTKGNNSVSVLSGGKQFIDSLKNAPCVVQNCASRRWHKDTVCFVL